MKYHTEFRIEPKKIIVSARYSNKQKDAVLCLYEKNTGKKIGTANIKASESKSEYEDYTYAVSFAQDTEVRLKIDPSFGGANIAAIRVE